MAKPNLQAALQRHGITASPRQLAAYVAESVESMEAGALVSAAQELPEGELDLLRAGGLDVDGGPAPGDDPIGRAVAAYSALMETALSIKEVAQGLGRNESRIGVALVHLTEHRAGG